MRAAWKIVGTEEMRLPLSALAASLVHEGSFSTSPDSPYLERYCSMYQRGVRPYPGAKSRIHVGVCRRSVQLASHAQASRGRCIP